MHWTGFPSISPLGRCSLELVVKVPACLCCRNKRKWDCCGARGTISVTKAGVRGQGEGQGGGAASWENSRAGEDADFVFARAEAARAAVCLVMTSYCARSGVGESFRCVGWSPHMCPYAHHICPYTSLIYAHISPIYARIRMIYARMRIIYAPYMPVCASYVPA